MDSGQRRFSRRALLLGGAAATGYGVYRLITLPGTSLSPGQSPHPTHPPPTSPGDGPGQVADLTVRWRNLQSRVEVPGLVAAWLFDETSGYAFADGSGNGHQLFVTGSRWNTTDSGLAGALHRKGMRGGAVWLDGTRWLEADLTADVNGRSGLTVSCRIRPQVWPAGSAVLVEYGASYRLTLEASGAAGWKLTDDAGHVHSLRTPPGAAAVGEWTHLSATADPATGQLCCYVDGVLAGRTGSRPFSVDETSRRPLIGKEFTGTVDEVTVHAVALEADAVRHLYVVGLPRIFTQSSESIDADRKVFTRFKGSDPVPHPRVQGTGLLLRFAGSAVAEEGSAPLPPTDNSDFVPGVFGGAWRADGKQLVYASPLHGDSGTFEAWLRPILDGQDPHRLTRKEIFTASGPRGSLTLYTQDSRWCVEVHRPDGRTDIVRASAQTFLSGTEEHVAVTWGRQANGSNGSNGIVLYADGVPCAALATQPGGTTYSTRVALGGTRQAPAYCILDDVRICDSALAWGEICPRGQAAIGAAGLDLRDRFDRPPGASPMLWRPGSPGGAWSHREMTWLSPSDVGDSGASRRALFQGTRSGVHPIYHPDAFGYASSIEAGVAFSRTADGWAGIFVQSPRTGGPFTGVTYMLNPALGLLRLARYQSGLVVEEKALPHDFAIRALVTYEITLTNAGDGIVRGFVDGSNVISMRAQPDWPAEGHAGMLTDGATAFFSNLHFCALTPTTPTSRVIRTRTIRYGASAQVVALDLVPFQWHKRPGLLPWEYTRQRPEPPGLIAGAATVLPPRPIGPAAWRAEDSANSDLVIVDGRVFYFMRGNPRIAGRQGTARIGVLYGEVAAFDAIHFTDPNAESARLTGGTVLLANPGPPRGGPPPPPQPGGRQLNSPATAYVGDGKLLFFGRVYSHATDTAAPYDAVVFSRFDTRTRRWEHGEPQVVPWGQPPDPNPTPSGADRTFIHGSPETVALREPDHDTYQAVVFEQVGSTGSAVMATALVGDVTGGVPVLVPGMPVHTSLSRPSGRAIYGFRVLFDNGIYYLHYNEGPDVPDWPARFVLAAAIDPYAGPWVVNPSSLPDDSTYFRRGSALHPDNGAIWQGTMFKHRGQYYLYYEAYHSIGDVDDPYAHYADPQAGSRVGFATA